MPLFVWIAIALAALIASASYAFNETVSEFSKQMNGPTGWLMFLTFIIIMAAAVRYALTKKQR